MKFFELTCNRCQNRRVKKMSVEMAIEELGSYCHKCKTGVIEVKYYKRPKPDQMDNENGSH